MDENALRAHTHTLQDQKKLLENLAQKPIAVLTCVLEAGDIYKIVHNSTVCNSKTWNQFK